MGVGVAPPLGQDRKCVRVVLPPVKDRTRTGPAAIDFGILDLSGPISTYNWMTG